MFVFSDPDYWEDDTGVWQMLVFSSVIMERKFQERYSSPNNRLTTGGYPTDTNIGALYKLRAIRNNSGRWNFVIRCGVTAMILEEVRVQVSTKESAMLMAVMHLNAKIMGSSSEKIKTLQMLHVRATEQNEEAESD